MSLIGWPQCISLLTVSALTQSFLQWLWWNISEGNFQSRSSLTLEGKSNWHHQVLIQLNPLDQPWGLRGINESFSSPYIPTSNLCLYMCHKISEPHKGSAVTQCQAKPHLRPAVQLKVLGFAPGIPSSLFWINTAKRWAAQLLVTCLLFHILFHLIPAMPQF